jgi:hypothetical protein
MLSYYTPVVLAGHTIMLEPLTLDHAPDLLQALNNDEEIWRYIPVEQPKTAAGDGSQRALVPRIRLQLWHILRLARRVHGESDESFFRLPVQDEIHQALGVDAQHVSGEHSRAQLAGGHDCPCPRDYSESGV